MTAMIRSMTDFVPVWRDRAAQLGLAHSTIDSISGLPDGYFGKVMCGMKSPGPKAVELINGALALKFIPQVDSEQEIKVSKRWVKRKRVPNLNASKARVKREEVAETSKQVEGFTRMQMLGRAGGMASGKKRRAQAMRRRELQRVRTHAARMRWAKRVTSSA